MPWIVYAKGVSYLIIIKNKTEASNNRFEWREGICRFLHCMEQQFGCHRHSRLPRLKFILICSAWFTLARIKTILDLIRNGRASYVI